ncbi:MAG: bifunctional biotin--[acetyl-CoA-carboxylase] ligase/biotin operon repressor BirA [Halieaceae bacterium]|nr:bifunctional biotin--[acetyl-CoA-carboxylase] ligase/biotin operon repressor BirA [Halieaceae bacterium]
MPKTTLLPLLADGEFHSGEEFAQALGVSRTAVWKQLQRLTELGLELEATRGRGYRIRGGLELLDVSSVRRELTPMASQLLQQFDLHSVIDSTNAEALRQAEAGTGAGYVCSAEQQTAGRGRRGRQWVSPFARNLYLSLLWEFEGGAAALEGLSLAVGVAVTQALEDCGLEAAQLKWPNDILHDDAKLGGVLLEMSGDAAGPCAVVLGVGINVAMPASAAGGIDQQWTDLTTANNGVSPGRNRVMAALLNHLLPMVAQFETTGFVPWREAWMQRDAFADSPVILSSGDQRQVGTARGVNERGALQLETSLGVQSIYGGEISMRPAADNA